MGARGAASWQKYDRYGNVITIIQMTSFSNMQQVDGFAISKQSMQCGEWEVSR